MNHARPETGRPAPAPQPRAAHEHLTIREVCAELKISRSTFYYWRQTGRAPRCLILPNREVRITRTELHTWLTQHTEQDNHQ
ncbi:MAG: helix-turn-helix transcriptional regulator [Nocardioides sp.]